MVSTAGIIIIGDEILSGRTKDANINWIASELNNVGIRLPTFIGMAIGYAADAVTKLIGKPLPVSSIRVKKFMATTQFSSSISNTGFVPPVSLEEGLALTLRYEFLDDNSGNETFDTE